jgi:hypothetical protein
MALKKELKLINAEIEYFENHVPCSWLGKWFKQVKLEKLKTRRNEIITELEQRKS